MYTFQPVVDTLANTHYGFFAGCLVLGTIALVVFYLWNDRECSTGTMLVWIVCLAGLTVTGYCESYRPEKVYANTPVAAELVGFQPEVRTEKHGKTYSDVRYMYVVYDVNGERVILKASEGVTYPKTTTLYRN